MNKRFHRHKQIWNNHRKKILASIISLFISAAILAVYSPFGYEKLAIANSVSWTGGGDGTTWEDGNNWSGGTVPGANDDVTIDGTASVTIAGTTTINSLTVGNGTNVTVLNFVYIAVANGALIIDDGNLTINTNSAIGSTTAGNVYIDVQTGSATISTLDVDGKGGAGGLIGGDGVGVAGGVGINDDSGNGGGGAHGGDGGQGYSAGSTGGTAYGSNTIITTAGSGGAGGTGLSTFGGNGGGLIKLTVAGDITVTNRITANGNAANHVSGAGRKCGGGGGGGGIGITTQGTLTLETGTIIRTLGGNGGNCTLIDSTGGGGGGGGRIAVYYQTLTNNGTISEIAGTGGSGNSGNNGSDGSAGTVYTYQYSVPDTPSIIGPIDGAETVSRQTSASSSAYSGDLTHLSSDWELSTASDDFTGTNLVAYAYDDATNKTSTTVNSTNFTFQNALAGKTELEPSTTYYIRGRHTNTVGDSAWSSGTHSYITEPNAAPDTPTITSHADGATSVSRTPTLTASAFSDNDPDDTHQSTTWTIATNSNFSNIIARSVLDTINLTSITVNSTNLNFLNDLTGKTELDASTIYFIRTGHIDSEEGASNWSPTVSFTTEANMVPDTPTISSPSDGATNQARNLTLTSTFNDSDSDDSHQSSDWEIYNTNTTSSEYLIAYKYDDTSNKTSIGVNSTNFTFQGDLGGLEILEPQTIYYIRTRQTDSAGEDSSWTSLTSFTTGTNVAPNKPSITSPTEGETDIGVNPTLQSSTFFDVDDNINSASSWEVYDNTNIDAEDRVWYVEDEPTLKTSITVNSVLGTFENSLNGRTRLLPGTTYYARVLHTDPASANSEWSDSVNFTTFAAPANPTLSSSSHSSEIDYFKDTTPDFTITAGSPTPDHYHYLINQTASPTKLDIEAGTEISSTTFTDTSETINANGTWYAHIVSHDANHNPSIFFDTYTIQYNSTAPTISNINISEVLKNSAIISWNTLNAATSRIDYGTTSEYYTDISSSSSESTSHQITLSNLSAGTTYYFKITSTDTYNQSDQSSEQNFTTQIATGGGSPTFSSAAISSSSSTDEDESDGVVSTIIQQTKETATDIGAKVKQIIKKTLKQTLTKKQEKQTTPRIGTGRKIIVDDLSKNELKTYIEKREKMTEVLTKTSQNIEKTDFDTNNEKDAILEIIGFRETTTAGKDKQKKITRCEMADMLARAFFIGEIKKPDKRPFKDISTIHACAGPVTALKQAGIIKGYPDGTFKKNKQINRAEGYKLIVEIIAYFFNLPEDGLEYFTLRKQDNLITATNEQLLLAQTNNGKSTSSFSDVDENAWYAEYILFAEKNGLIPESEDMEFKPDEAITIEEMETLVVESLKFFEDNLDNEAQEAIKEFSEENDKDNEASQEKNQDEKNNDDSKDNNDNNGDDINDGEQNNNEEYRGESGGNEGGPYEIDCETFDNSDRRKIRSLAITAMQTSLENILFIYETLANIATSISEETEIPIVADESVGAETISLNRDEATIVLQILNIINQKIEISTWGISSRQIILATKDYFTERGFQEVNSLNINYGEVECPGIYMQKIPYDPNGTECDEFTYQDRSAVRKLGRQTIQTTVGNMIFIYKPLEKIAEFISEESEIPISVTEEIKDLRLNLQTNETSVYNLLNIIRDKIGPITWGITNSEIIIGTKEYFETNGFLGIIALSDININEIQCPGIYFKDASEEPVCGNTEIEEGEECDNGNENGSVCEADYNGSCTYCTETCEEVTVQGGVCGDEQMDNEYEKCDTGEQNGIECIPEYGADCTYCTETCEEEIVIADSCGDGILNESFEKCDTGDQNGIECIPEYDEDCTFCTETCTEETVKIQEYCGDGITNKENEKCDLGEENGTPCEPSIDEDCSYCGEDCETKTLQYEAYCGDGIVNAVEETCDTGTENGTKCETQYDKDCTWCTEDCEEITEIANFCGDGIVQQENETCDAGKENGIPCEAAYGEECAYCTETCEESIVSGPSCGDGIVQQEEICDNGVNDGQETCTNTCTLTFCGDGSIQLPNGEGADGPENDGYEICDDGNNLDGDGCSSDCQREEEEEEEEEEREEQKTEKEETPTLQTIVTQIVTVITSGGGGAPDNATPSTDSSAETSASSETTPDETTKEETSKTKMEESLGKTMEEAAEETTKNITGTDSAICELYAGSTDMDGDGLSDFLECLSGTEIDNRDTDQDGATDAEEILEFQTNPKDKNDTPPTKEETEKQIVTITPYFTNLLKGTKIIDNTPIFQGVATPKSLVSFVLVNKEGQRFTVEKQQTTDQGKFLFEPPELLTGDYTLYIRQINPKTGETLMVSAPAKFTVTENDNTIETPLIESIEGINIENRTSKRITIKERRPKITIKNPAHGNIIMAHWKSAIFASALLADSINRDIVLSPPQDLEPGDHSVWIYALRPGDNTRSSETKIDFTIAGIAPNLLEQNIPRSIGIVVLIVFSIVLLYFHSFKKHKTENRKKNTKFRKI